MTDQEISNVIKEFVIDIVIFGLFDGTIPEQLKDAGITKCEVTKDGAFVTYFADGTEFPWAEYVK